MYTLSVDEVRTREGATKKVTEFGGHWYEVVLAQKDMEYQYVFEGFRGQIQTGCNIVAYECG